MLYTLNYNYPMSFFVTASIEQLSWQDVRDIVAIENPLLAEIIDEISPGKDFPIILETAVAPSRVILANAGSRVAQELPPRLSNNYPSQS